MTYEKKINTYFDRHWCRISPLFPRPSDDPLPWHAKWMVLNNCRDRSITMCLYLCHIILYLSKRQLPTFFHFFLSSLPLLYNIVWRIESWKQLHIHNKDYFYRNKNENAKQQQKQKRKGKVREKYRKIGNGHGHVLSIMYECLHWVINDFPIFFLIEWVYILNIYKYLQLFIPCTQ